MPSRNDKNKDVLKDLEKTISPVLVVNNSSLKPYVELFEYSPENIYQQPLGSLVGFFEVKEYSDDSAYIVNFLTSVLKKEYYINPKRPVDESLDSALHKVNLALSELVKHGNIEWLGKLNAAICVLEKNNAHFSVAGNAKIFLYRNTVLTEVSEDLASDSIEPHPLKTFVNVSSGRLEKNDRLLVTSEDIFHILSFTELKKNFQRFEGEKFVQFLKTALSNQIEMIASVVVEMTETVPIQTIKMTNSGKKLQKTINAFSEKTFAETVTHSEKTSEENASQEESNPEYTDKKTGHIYVQGEANESQENTQMSLYWDITKEKIAQIWYASKSNISYKISAYKNKVAKKRELLQAEREKQRQLAAIEKQKQQELKAAKKAEREKLEMERLEQMEAEKKERQEFLARQNELEKQELERKKIEKQKELELENRKIEEKKALETEAEVKRLQEEKIAEEETAETQQTTLSFKEKLQQAIAEQRREKSVIDLRSPKKTDEEIDDVEVEIEDRISDFFRKVDARKNAFENEIEKNKLLPKLKAFIQETWKKSQNLLRNMLLNSLEAVKSGRQKFFIREKKSELSPELDKVNIEASLAKKESRFVPHLSKIKKLFSSFSSAQKVYAILALLVIFIVPIFINRWINRPKPQMTAEVPAAVKSPSELLANEKNINLSPEKNALLSRNDIVGILATNSGTAAIEKNSIIMIESDGQQKEYPLPQNSGVSVKAAFMQDLSLVFVLTDTNKIISFSPVSAKYTENNISLPANSSSDFIGTYLTYLYILDPASNQIYRYPRATGGFGEKTGWLKDATSLSGASDMTLDDNIYVIQNNNIMKFFKGKIQSFSLESSNTPVHFDKIFTTVDSQSIYVLDAVNSRIIEYSKADGSIIKQYFDESLKGSTSLTVDGQNRTAYVGTPNGLISIGL